MSAPMSPTALKWARLVAELESSGQNVRDFAASRDVNASTLAWWRSQLRAKRHPTFLEVVVATPPTTAPLRIRIDGRPVCLEIVDGVSVDLLRTVLAALC